MSEKIKVGDQAPGFELPSADMEMLDSKSWRGKKNMVLYFYPKDDTPGCTIEAQEFTDLKDEFDELDTEILGISRDNCGTHGEFRDKYGLTIQLLADVDGKACEDYGVWQEKERNGEKRMGIVRSTFVIDKDCVIRHALYNVKPKGHAEDVLELVKVL